MMIGGLQRFSLLDYPGKVSAIIFTQRCNLRCGFCYNPMLVWPKKASEVKNISGKGKCLISGNEKGQYSNEDDLFRFLKKRVGKLDGVVISGGEPTIHKDLPNFIEKIKAFGYKIKLDTNGTNPKMLEKLTSSLSAYTGQASQVHSDPILTKKRGKREKEESLIDYIAMDIKASEDKYNEAVGKKINFKNIEKSAKIIRESKLPFEFRTTLVRGLANKKEVEEISNFLGSSDTWFLQKFKPNTDLLNKKFKEIKPFTDIEMEEFRRIGRKRVKKCEIR